MKDFIPIPTNVCRRPRVIRMMMKEKCSGMGALMMIILYLRECDNYRCHNDAEEIAIAAMVQDVDLVRRVISQYGLFEVEDKDYIYSPWLREQMAAYDLIKEKRSMAGRASAAARKKASENTEHVLNSSSDLFQQKNEQNSAYTQQNSAYNQQYISNKDNVTQQPKEAGFSMSLANGWSGSEKDLEKLLREKGTGLSAEMVAWVENRYGSGHPVMYLVTMANKWNMSDNQFRFLYKITDQFKSSDPTMKKVIGIASKASKDGFVPTFPLNFIISKLK